MEFRKYENSSVKRSLFSASRTMRKTQIYVSSPRLELSERGLSLQLLTRSPGVLRPSDLVFYMGSSWKYILVSSFRIIQFHNQYLKYRLSDVSFYTRSGLQISNKCHRKPNLDSSIFWCLFSFNICPKNTFQIFFTVILCGFSYDSGNISLPNSLNVVIYFHVNKKAEKLNVMNTLL